MKVYKFLLLFLFLITGITFVRGQDFIDTRGNDFWVTFLPNYHNYEDFPLDNYKDSLYIFIVGYDTCSGRIEYRDISGVPRYIDFQITDPKQIYKFNIAYMNFELQGYNRSGDVSLTNHYQCEEIAKQSFHITSTKDITVYAHEQASTTSESMTALPTDALGTEYLVLTYNSDGQVFGGLDEGTSTPSQFAVIATEDGTEVTIIPSCPTRVNGLKTQKINLMKGDVYLVQANITYGNLNGDLSGTQITSTKPISLVVGHQRASVPFDAQVSSRDCLLEQLPPLTAWGRNAIVTPFAQSKTITSINAYDLFRVMSSSDGTEIFIDGESIGIYNRGEFAEYTLTDPHFITANAPILACQYKKSAKGVGGTGKENSDPLMMIMPPIEQYGNFYRIANIQSYETDPNNNNKKFPVYTEHYVSIITHDSLAGEIEIDGNKIDPAFFKKIPGTQFSYCYLGVQEGTHELKAPSGFGLNVYGYGYANSYGYYGGMNLTKYDYRPPQIEGMRDCYEINGYISDSTEVDTKLVTCEAPVNDIVNTAVTITDLKFPALVQHFQARLVNVLKDGSFTLKAVDSTGLFTTKKYEIPGFTIGIEGTKGNDSTIIIIRDTITTNKEYCWDFPIENYGKFTHTLIDIFLESGPNQEKLNQYLPLTLNPGDKSNLKICKTFLDTGYYEYRLFITDTCATKGLIKFELFALKDNNPPRLQSSQDTCNSTFYFEISEPLKSDTGIEKINILNEENGKLEIENSNSKYTKMYFKVVDSRKDAYFKFIVLDSAGNETTYEKAIPGFTLQFAGNPLDSLSKIFNFGERMIGSRHSDTLQITNYGKFLISLSQPLIKNNLLFSIPQSQFPMLIPAGETRNMVIIYKPISYKKYKDRDTIIISMNCLDEIIPLEGTALEFNVKGDSKCDVPIRFRTDSIPTSLEASILPNVTNGITNLKFDSPENVEINVELLDQIGNHSIPLFIGTIPAGKSEKIFNLSDLSNGVYFLRISTGQGSANIKIIKIK